MIHQTYNKPFACTIQDFTLQAEGKKRQGMNQPVQENRTSLDS